MAKRLRAVTAGLSYPCAADLEMVREAGGMSKLTKENHAKVKARERKPKVGEWCDDMPAESVAYQLLRGRIEEVEVEAAMPRLRRRAGGKGGN